MASIFNTLNIGYTGLTAAQVGVTTTSHNIANAESEGYTRQRVMTAASTPIAFREGQVGNGVDVTEIERIFDNFVYDRYTKLSSDKEYSDFTKQTLEELSSYFPEIDEVGIKSDLKEYYNMWQSFSDNPSNDAMKLALAKQTETLSQTISLTQSRIIDLQSTINDQLFVNINEVNALAKQLAGVNASIVIEESNGGHTANDLRDKRGSLEKSLARLIGAEAKESRTDSNIRIDSNSTKASGSYTLSVNGFNIVDGSSYHQIHIANVQNENSFYELSYERQDGVLIPMDESIQGGKIGAILDLRGDRIEDAVSGIPSNGTLQKVITQMDAFVATLIESTNNIYASSSTARMESNRMLLKQNDPILSTSMNVRAGSFDFVIYDIDGNISARKTININNTTVMTGLAGSNSIEGQIKAQSDDNGDGNARNDIDDFIEFNWASYSNGENAIEIIINPVAAGKGYVFAIEDKLQNSDFNSGSNFAGALGLHRFLDGTNASNINLNFNLRENSTDISAGISPLTGDNKLALNIMQQQFENYNFKIGNIEYETTIYGMFDIVSTEVGITTNEAILFNETITAQFSSTELEYSSISKVSIDEELTNLIKYQTSYGAASKVITTIDQMMTTLLGIKQ